MQFLSTTTNLLLIIAGFGVLIFVHELGHFLAARWAGIRTDAFAIGMGPAMFSWRKGAGFAWGTTHALVVKRTGKAPRDLSRAELDRYGLSSTEYSLRWLPIGGFVRMLGQDDADPGNVSNDPESYNVCPVNKRMVVISAGVIANLVLAVALFIVAFLAGVQSEMPVVGEVPALLPAGSARANNAAALGIDGEGLRPGDLITRIDGEEVKTFVDVRVKAAMSKPGHELLVEVKRPGVDVPLEFPITPRKDGSGLLGIGIDPARSTRLSEDDSDGSLLKELEKIGLAAGGVRPGMLMVRAGGRQVDTYEQFQEMVDALDGAPVPAEWVAAAEGEAAEGPAVRVEVPSEPDFDILLYPVPPAGVDQNAEQGLIGLAPLVRIRQVFEKSGGNHDRLRADDVILRAGAADGPRMATFRAEVARHSGGEIDLVVLRGDEEVPVRARVDRKGRLNVGIEGAWDLPLIAEPMERLRRADLGAQGEDALVPSPVSGLLLMPRTRIDAVGGTAVTDWASFREALRRGTEVNGRGANLTLTVTHPTPGREPETMDLVLSEEDVARLHDLGWSSRLARAWFDPRFTTLSAEGNPFRAAIMGFEETYKVAVMTYLTIDRLVRGSVGVEQIRGPVGIVHVGTQVADRGFTYLIFFLGIISVNLAVINFLPLPIVDGGLFLFLIYEKLKGRPPSLAFQNAAAIAGVALIATALLVVTWNDLMRLVG